jgi:hypothetical protein
LPDGKKLTCFEKPVWAESYSEATPFSKGQIVIQYTIAGENVIKVINIFFP